MMLWYDEKLELDACTIYVLSLAWPLELIEPLAPSLSLALNLTLSLALTLILTLTLIKPQPYPRSCIYPYGDLRRTTDLRQFRLSVPCMQ